MTTDQYLSLLRDLAGIAGMADPAPLLTQGRLSVGETRTVLEHDPDYDPDLLQVRLLLGALPGEDQDIVARALLETNYVSGYGGECVFSLMPETDDAVITMKMRLHPALSAPDLWQELSDVAMHGQQMWNSIVATVEPMRDGLQAATA
jgi:hypothetical protein